MRLLFLVIILLSINFVFSDENVEMDRKTLEEVEKTSVKTKRGIKGYASDMYGRTFTRYVPSYGDSPTYALTHGNAVIHSFNINYPKVFLTKRPTTISTPSILYHTKPIFPQPSIYANRYPVFVHKPVIVHKPLFPTVPQFTTPTFIPSTPSVLPQPTLVSQNGWRPIFSAAPNVRPINPPAVTVLPPANPLPTISQTQTPNNYYLPPVPAVQYDSVGYTQSTGDCF